MPCPMCESGESVLLGVMGKVVHYRCRRCGIYYSSPLDEDEMLSFVGWDEENEDEV